ncbi:MFS transporter [Rhodococcus sp. 114MFTsu3.1]|uniref:MFS transporter n=1 Tax=Rhodococcus sp. 114MFTsu3.1 TaxID=1172184 RepID=UPI0018CB9FC0|nr:MFS transporter [Rhodococcus sp. 114MFTsu3.1]
MASGTRTPQRFAFATATVALVAVFAASGAPLPLYERYRAAEGLSTQDLSLAAVAYFVAVLIALVVLGRLSDHLGRRVVALAAVVLAAIGSLILLDVSNLSILLIGRVFHGVACGLASSALTTYVIDTAPDRPRWLAAGAAAGAPVSGLTIGALGTGALAQYAPAPLVTTYLIDATLLAVCAALLLFAHDPVDRRPGTLTSLRPRVSIPASVRPLLPGAVAVFGSTWALGGFYQAFSPTIAARDLGSSNTLVAAAVFASFMAPYALGGPLTARLPPSVAQRAGIVVFAVAVAGVASSLLAGSTVGVMSFGLIAGAAQGVTFTGSVRLLLAGTMVGERAGLMSAVYLFSYCGAAVPSLVSGRMSSTVGLPLVALGYAAFAALAAVITVRTSHADK